MIRAMHAVGLVIGGVIVVQATWMNANRQEERVGRLCRALMATSGRFSIHRAPLPLWPVLEWMATEQDAVLEIHEKECIP